MSIILDNFLLEKTLSSKDRKKLKDSDYGVPQERKFPLIDKNHVNMAIRYFYSVDKKFEYILAKNINDKAKKIGLKIHVSKSNPFYKYADKDILKKE